MISSADPSFLQQWSRGCVLGSAQNFARELMETPSNHMTPSLFVEAVSEKIGEIKQRLSNQKSIEVIPRYVCACTVMKLK